MFPVERQSSSQVQLKHKNGRRVTVSGYNPIKVSILNIN
jgi:predicted RNA binding protein YcfA (HicA-like mRNA interferase family)